MSEKLGKQKPAQQAGVSPLTGIAPPEEHQFKPGQSGNPKAAPPRQPMETTSMSNEAAEATPDQQQDLPAGPSYTSLDKETEDPQEGAIEKNSPRDDCFTRALGTPHPGLQDHIMNQISGSFAGVYSSDGCDKKRMIDAIDNASAIIYSIQPRDELETLLLVQAIATHNLSVKCLQNALMAGQGRDGRESNTNMATKLSRTFIAQLEALKRYRGEGQPKKTNIGTVNVNDHAQAVVGDITQRTGPDGKKPE